MTHHPFRAAPLHVFERIFDGDMSGYAFIAQFHPYKTYPVFFPGATEEAARVSAETFRDETVAKYEAQFIARQEAIEKARLTREAKKEAAK